MGCSNTPVVETRTVTKNVPVVVRIDDKLLAPCVVDYRYPSTIIEVDHLIRTIDALEKALLICNKQLFEIAKTQDAVAN